MKKAAKRLLALSNKIAKISIGHDFESEKSMIRAHRFMNSLKVWDLSNAGKRGKKVDSFTIMINEDNDIEVKALEEISKKAEKAKHFIELKLEAISIVDDALDNDVQIDFYKNNYRGVDIQPAGFKPIKLKGKYVDIEAGYNRFVVRDKQDEYNLPTCMPAANGKRDIKLFYRWLKDNEKKVKNMTFNEIVRELQKNKIKYNQYCSMD